MNELKPMLASYARSFIAAGLAVYMAGVQIQRRFCRLELQLSCRYLCAG
jgi:hypothetical protein